MFAHDGRPEPHEEAEMWDRTWQALAILWQITLTRSPFKAHRYDTMSGQIVSRRLP
jgi:hypothetical protein